jgi:hypothetical protein
MWPVSTTIREKTQPLICSSAISTELISCQHRVQEFVENMSLANMPHRLEECSEVEEFITEIEEEISKEVLGALDPWRRNIHELAGDVHCSLEELVKRWYLWDNGLLQSIRGLKNDDECFSADKFLSRSTNFSFSRLSEYFAFINVERELSVFCTDSGALGFASGTAQEGDSVVDLPGSETPAVLRKRENTDEYEFHGFAIVTVDRCEVSEQETEFVLV